MSASSAPQNSSTPSTPARTWRYDLALLSVVLVWSANGVAIKHLTGLFEPLPLFLARGLGVCALLNLGSYLFRRQPVWVWDSRLLPYFWAGLILVVQNNLFFYSMEYTTAGEGILFLSTAPLFTAGIVALLGREKFRKRNWAGAALALGGVALVVFYAPAYDPAYAPNRLLGNTLMLFSAALYGLYMVVVRDWLHRWGALRVLAGGYTVALLLSLPLSLVPFLAIDWSALSLTHWGSLGFTMVVAGVYGFVVWYAVIKRTSSARTAVFQYLIPPATVIFAWLLLGEQLTGLQILGMGLTLAGVFWARPLQTPLRRLPTRTV